MRRRRAALEWLTTALGIATPALAQVYSSEFMTDPVSEGWELITQFCDPVLWVEDGNYHQQLSLAACPGASQGGHDSYRRSLESLNGAEEYFLEYRVFTNGDRTEIPGGAPTVVAIANNAGVLYHVTVARDRLQFFRDANLLIRLIDINPELSHVYRIELFPNMYAFYIDGYLIDHGFPEGPFPAYNSFITWRRKSWKLPCENAWDYIRYGVIPQDGSGDFDSDAAITLIDHYFVYDCLAKDGPGIFGGPENSAGPGCRFADFDSDADVDLRDFAEFQNLFMHAE